MKINKDSLKARANNISARLGFLKMLYITVSFTMPFYPG